MHDLSIALQKLKVDARVFQKIEEARDDSIIILSKGDYSLRHRIDSKRIVGAINVSSDCRTMFDFVIVGSTEEKKSLENFYNNVLIINLIESMYENEKLKVHEEKDLTTIGFHGSFTHLSKMRYGFSQAVQQLTEEGHKIKVVCLTNDVLPNNVCGQLQIDPNIFESHRWSYSSAKSIIQSFDMGIVPNITDLNQIYPQLKSVTSVGDGLYTTDYSLRFKNKSNPGRAFVFFQLGIPVISDLTPSNMPMFFDETCGYLAVCPDTWKKSIIKLMNANHRNTIAQNAYLRFRSLYSFEEDVNKLLFVLEQYKK